LKFIDFHQFDEKDKITNRKFYTNLLRSYLTTDLLQLLSIHCYELDDEKGSNYDLYKSYIEKYSFLEHISFVDSDRKVLFPILCVFNYYLENAFDKNIWIKSNSIIKKVYRSKSNDICTPFLDLFLRKRINCSLTESNLYLKANKEKNCYEFNFHSKKFETYKS